MQYFFQSQIECRNEGTECRHGHGGAVEELVDGGDGEGAAADQRAGAGGGAEQGARGCGWRVDGW